MSEFEEILSENYNMTTKYWNESQNNQTEMITTTITLNITKKMTSIEKNQEYMIILRLYIASILLTLILISVIVNLIILLSVFWIRRPISPTLQLSLSMTTSDTFSLIIIAWHLIVNTLFTGLPWIGNDCSLLVVETLRYGTFTSTIFHIFALAGNHYLGVKHPLHYNIFMTHRIINILIALLWILPPSLFAFAFYFFVNENEGYRSPECNKE